MTIPSDQRCPFCNEVVTRVNLLADAAEIDCPVCGEFRISQSAITVLNAGSYAGERWILASVSRRAFDAGVKPRFNADDLDRVVRETRMPTSPLEIGDDLLLAIAQASQVYGRAATIGSSEWARYGLRERDALGATLRMLVDLNLITWSATDGSMFPVVLTAKGWSRVVELRRDTGEGRLAFVAMSFHESMTEAFDQGIRPAIEDDCGYQAVRVDRKQYNDRIDDHIIAELRRARFVVADMTMQRQGVYFEAGYGLGRGLQVIYTCQSDDMKNVHFDTRQYNHISWTSPLDLRTKLADRVRATIGARV